MTDLRYDNPAQIGWYATLHCWEAEEGIFPSAHFWDGSTWQSDPRGLRVPSIRYWPIVFESAAAAEAYAYEHDPER